MSKTADDISCGRAFNLHAEEEKLGGTWTSKTHYCGGNIADVIMFPKFWLVSPRLQHLWRTQKNVSENFANICCARAARDIVADFPRTGNVVGHNVTATMCPGSCLRVRSWKGRDYTGRARQKMGRMCHGNVTKRWIWPGDISVTR